MYSYTNDYGKCNGAKYNNKKPWNVKEITDSLVSFIIINEWFKVNSVCQSN